MKGEKIADRAIIGLGHKRKIFAGLFRNNLLPIICITGPVLTNGGGTVIIFFERGGGSRRVKFSRT